MRHITKNPTASIVIIALAAILTASLAGVFIASPSPQAAPAAQAAPSPADAQLATIKQYCSGCHNDKAKTGGVSFEGVTAASIAKDPELFEKAVRKLRGRVMPPPGAKQPDGKAVDSLGAWVAGSLGKGSRPG